MKLEDFFIDPRELVIDWDKLFQMPEFQRLETCKQDHEWHRESVVQHTKNVVEKMVELVQNTQFSDMEDYYMPMVCVVAAILHDIGKPVSNSFNENTGKWCSPMHANIGETIARRLLRDGTTMPLREAVCWLIRNHMMFHYLYDSKEGKQKTLLLTLFRQRDYLVPYLLMLYKADCLGSDNDKQTERDVDAAVERIQADLKKVVNSHSRALRTIAKMGNQAGLFNELSLHVQDGRFPFRLDKFKRPQGPEFGVYVMVGISGAGKNHYVDNHIELIEMMEKCPPVVISLDDIRRDHFHLPEEHLFGDEKQEQEAVEIMRQQFKEACRAGRPVIINNTNLSRKRRMEFKRMAQGFNAKFKYIFVDTDVETCVERRIGRVDEGIVRSMSCRLDYPQPDEYDSLETVLDGKSVFNGGSLYTTAVSNERHHPINPIVDNRLVSGQTFAVRLKSFIESVQPSCAIDEEEKEYLLCVADDLLKYQINTATDTDEVGYLDRLGLI